MWCMDFAHFSIKKQAFGFKVMCTGGGMKCVESGYNEVSCMWCLKKVMFMARFLRTVL